MFSRFRRGKSFSWHEKFFEGLHIFFENFSDFLSRLIKFGVDNLQINKKLKL